MDLIRELPAELSDVEVFDILSRKDTTVTDSALHSYRELVRRFGPDLTNTVLAKLEVAAKSSALLRITFQALSSQGIDFSHAAVQGMLTQLQADGAFTAAEATALKEIGVRQVSRLDRAGLAGIKFSDVVQALKDERYRLAVKEKIRNAYNACIVLAERGELTLELWQPFAEDILAGLQSIE